MIDTNEELPPDWAIEEALRRGGHHSTTDQVKSFQVDMLYRAILAHARTIAKHEQPPVDPDVRLVADVINAFYGDAWGEADIAMRKEYALALSRAVAVYRERKQ